MINELRIEDYISQVNLESNLDQVQTQEEKDTNGYFPFLNLLCCLSKNSLQNFEPIPSKEQESNYHTPQPSKYKRIRSTPISLKSREKLQSSPPSELIPLLPLSLEKKKTLILDLDETLVHSSIKEVPNYSFTVDIQVNSQIKQKVYVLKRPGVDDFLIECGKYYEVVIFTASLSSYADSVINLLDTTKVVSSRLFREHCTLTNGIYLKDLGRLGRELSQVIIIDNSPSSYFKHPKNAIPVSSWIDDPNDKVLFDLKNQMERISKVENVYDILKEFKKL